MILLAMTPPPVHEARLESGKTLDLGAVTIDPAAPPR